MAKLSKVDAAKAAGVSRQTLYTYIKDGRVSVDTDGLIDTAELLRAGFALHDIGRPILDTTGHALTSTVSSVDTMDFYRDMLTMLRQQLQEAQAREQAALERERVARDREALLLTMLHEAQQRYDRLLEAPRPAQTSPPAPARPRPPQARRTRTVPPQTRQDAQQGMSQDTPPYDTSKYALGSLCLRGHRWQGTDFSLRQRVGNTCIACKLEDQRRRRRRQREQG